jgi:hypothetical protein
MLTYFSKTLQHQISLKYFKASRTGYMRADVRTDKHRALPISVLLDVTLCSLVDVQGRSLRSLLPPSSG